MKAKTMTNEEFEKFFKARSVRVCGICGRVISDASEGAYIKSTGRIDAFVHKTCLTGGNKNANLE